MGASQAPSQASSVEDSSKKKKVSFVPDAKIPDAKIPDVKNSQTLLDSWSRSEIGLPFTLTHFAAQDYEHHYQNWEVVQDERGVVYVANHDGVLEYDGHDWRLIPTLTNTTVRSLALSDSALFVGAQGDIGYLTTDSLGAKRYVSLIDEVPRQARGFEDVWGTHVTPEGVYFQTKQWLFRWDGKRIEYWKSKADYFHTSFLVHDQLYVRESGRGLLSIKANALQLIPGGSQLANNSVYAMVPYGDDQILIATSKKGFLLYDGHTFTPFPTEADAFMEEHQLYDGQALSGGRFAFATLGGGVIVIDRKGRVVQMLDQESGLPGNYVTSVYAGSQGGVWVTFGNSGLARADLRPQLSRFDNRLGLEGIIYEIRRYLGVLYVATGTGVYRLERSEMAPLKHERASFERISGAFQAWDLEDTSYGLLAAGEKGVYVIHGGQAQQLIGEPVYSLMESAQFERRIYAGTENGLALLRKEADGWTMQPVRNVKTQVRSFVEDSQGTLWASNEQGYVIRAQFASARDRTPQIARFDTSDGLPNGEVAVAFVGGEPVFYSARSGLYHMHPTPQGKAAFEPDTTLRVMSRASLLALAESDGNVWMVYRNHVGIALQKPDGSYTRVTPPSLRFPRGVTRLYVEDSLVAWISDGDKLIRYQPYGKDEESTDFPVLIRRVKAVGEDDLVFGGSGTQSKQAAVKLPYAQNSLRFTFTAPNYRPTVTNQYQYRLKGEDRSWSDWSTRQEKTYASLGPGRYQFEVRAGNSLATDVTAASYSFRILPPWYRTWWAYGAYLTMIVLLGIGYWRYRQLLAASRRAEERARELKRERRLSRRLKEVNARLEEANRLKDELLANTSHELRTPLTSIQGYTEVLKEELSDRHSEFLGYIESNTQRLIQTVESLLSLAKLRAGVMDVNREAVDLGAQAAEVIELLRPLAQKKNLTLRLDRKAPGVRLSTDPQYLHQILNNLVSNAIKFTDKGEVTVSVDRFGGEAILKVRDTGIGISQEFIPHIFESFEQESTGNTRTYEGSGLGLSITSHLVEMLDGTISVNSVKGEGSVFIVTFPTDDVKEKALA